jgi:hypothetical protein
MDPLRSHPHLESCAACRNQNLAIIRLQRHPGAIGAIANALAAMGPDAQSALPALRVALTALEPRAGASPMDMAQANRSRDALVDAIQKIAPNQPKPLFTESDVRSVLATIDDPSIMADGNLRQRLAAALSPVLADFNGRAIELTPTQMHHLLDALKTVDQPIYDTHPTLINFRPQRLPPPSTRPDHSTLMLNGPQPNRLALTSLSSCEP